MALVKCPICSQREHKENMIQEDKRYYHVEYCHERWKRDKEATRIENQQWDDLYQYIIKLHDIIVLPTGNITRLKDLRAGFEFKDGQRVRKWNTGPTFELMLEAYLLAEDSIRWCIANKLDGSRDTRAINYGVSIMIDKLNEAFARKKRREQHTEQFERTKISSEDKNISNEILKNKHNKIDEMDISSFL
ncbi:hypothetical protein [Paenibacillus donghaensis]|uniref:Uncharacterized protein n=1 Tax=Paenibacillus donghaensis TaxID=414771 RepID=A0A2Z2KH93_9BACL|nr:hypothetical protein [Paenibacillus donghaensis]ASA22613.1 hypothetical protein B9T62_18575 [Paenibacillus donghaensis]